MKEKYKKKRGGAMPGSGRPKKTNRVRVCLMLEPDVDAALSVAATLEHKTRPDWMNDHLREVFFLTQNRRENMKSIGGGPLSKYAESCDGGGFSEGEKIVPITEMRARVWAELIIMFAERLSQTDERYKYSSVVRNVSPDGAVKRDPLSSNE